jgi:hypothetical protein
LLLNRAVKLLNGAVEFLNHAVEFLKGAVEFLKGAVVFLKGAEGRENPPQITQINTDVERKIFHRFHRLTQKNGDARLP